MTDCELVAYVYAWGEPPPRAPDGHRLYYLDHNGWWYLTAEGMVLLRDPLTQDMLRQQEVAVSRWASDAASNVMRKFLDWP